MALTDIFTPEHKVEAGSGQSFTVRGLCFDDIVVIMQRDPAGLAVLLGEISAGAVPEVLVEAHFPEIMAKVPGLPAQIIACASDDTSEAAVAIARRLPLPVQIDALLNIIRLTFEPVGGIKKFVAQVRNALETEGVNLPTLASMMALANLANTGS